MRVHEALIASARSGISVTGRLLYHVRLGGSLLVGDVRTRWTRPPRKSIGGGQGTTTTTRTDKSFEIMSRVQLNVCLCSVPPPTRISHINIGYHARPWRVRVHKRLDVIQGMLDREGLLNKKKKMKYK
jgi:hypothetical protein